ncbi:hypothetical protein QQP08_024485 [Theobroma cacao]|nr:hypothetical protein QQP08_024485 [Theobroma cacao]
MKLTDIVKGSVNNSRTSCHLAYEAVTDDEFYVNEVGIFLLLTQPDTWCSSVKMSFSYPARWMGVLRWKENLVIQL